ncbi:DUF2695 domain-containing protein [Breznakiella homolactica]|uniref:DUF2695 domain-containing protein n=1 Tax=Breznakiella homolactica TaxID=2798577 RepID=A0A7T7XJP6_9SPIR|nr:DUF2695 domain-containing protein [Breznakiella homolactica]QQO07616.1 DUF2695 domain-containing protein [Breznakiella homolactica]
MPNNEEKLRRKKILEDIKTESRKQFHDSLPMAEAEFKGLFDYLDETLSERECGHTNTLTREYLEKGGADTERVLTWLAEQGGYCDCEILGNAEELFEN